MIIRNKTKRDLRNVTIGVLLCVISAIIMFGGYVFYINTGVNGRATEIEVHYENIHQVKVLTKTTGNEILVIFNDKVHCTWLPGDTANKGDVHIFSIDGNTTEEN